MTTDTSTEETPLFNATKLAWDYFQENVELRARLAAAEAPQDELPALLRKHAGREMTAEEVLAQVRSAFENTCGTHTEEVEAFHDKLMDIESAIRSQGEG